MRFLMFGTVLGSALLWGCSNTVTGAGGSGGLASTSTGTSAATTATSGTTTATATGSTSVTGTTATATTTATGSTSTGMTMQSGDCLTDNDCMPGGHCVEVAPGGFRLCQFPVMEATMCMSSQDACCTSAMCMTGTKCFEAPIVPFCAGIVMQPHNVCASAECMTSADCTNGDVCMPAGTFGNKVAACLSAKCTKDTDCTAQAGGKCGTVEEPCCHTTTGLYCTYPGNCRKDSDCGANHYCGANASGQYVCQQGIPICPG